MSDFGTITAVLSNIKVATDIAKALRESDISIERAELRLKLAEMIGALADAKMEIIDIQQLLTEKESQLAALEEAFQSKDSLLKRYDAYYLADSKGDPIGAAFCMNCWQIRHKKYNLHYTASDVHTKVCGACNTKYDGRMTADIAP